jgi:hypothetical protein
MTHKTMYTSLLPAFGHLSSFSAARTSATHLYSLCSSSTAMESVAVEGKDIGDYSVENFEFFRIFPKKKIGKNWYFW